MEDTQMTIMDAINRIDNLKPNRYEMPEKIMWLNTLDERIMKEIIAKYEGPEGFVHNGYTEDTALTTELIAHAPHDEVYLYWLEAQVDYWNGEYAKYNNSIEMFNTAYTAFANYYHRTHMPRGKKFKFF